MPSNITGLPYRYVEELRMRSCQHVRTTRNAPMWQGLLCHEMVDYLGEAAFAVVAVNQRELHEGVLNAYEHVKNPCVDCKYHVEPSHLNDQSTTYAVYQIQQGKMTWLFHVRHRADAEKALAIITDILKDAA